MRTTGCWVRCNSACAKCPAGKMAGRLENNTTVFCWCIICTVQSAFHSSTTSTRSCYSPDALPSFLQDTLHTLNYTEPNTQWFFHVWSQGPFGSPPRTTSEPSDFKQQEHVWEQGPSSVHRHASRSSPEAHARRPKTPISAPATDTDTNPEPAPSPVPGPTPSFFGIF